MSELSEIDGITAAPTTGAIQRLEAEAAAMTTAYKLATGLSRTEMVPEQYQTGKHGDQATYNLTAAIMFGMEIGLSAVQAAQNIFIVRGKPAMYSTTMAACIRRAGYVIEPVEETDQGCVWKGFRDGTWAYSEWTMARASTAGYTSNKLYQTNPKAMLRAKCIAEIARIKFQDVLVGMAHTVEELQLDTVTVQRVVPKKRGLAALQELAADAPATGSNTPPPEPDKPKPEPKQEPEPAKAAVSKETIKATIVAGKANGINTAEELFADLSAFMGSPVAAWDDLTAEDADAYLKSLKETAR